MHNVDVLSPSLSEGQAFLLHQLVGGGKTRRSHTRPELHFAQQPHLEKNGAKPWQLHNSTKNVSPWMKIFLRLTKFHLTERQKKEWEKRGISFFEQISDTLVFQWPVTFSDSENEDGYWVFFVFFPSSQLLSTIKCYLDRMPLVLCAINHCVTDCSFN